MKYNRNAKQISTTFSTRRSHFFNQWGGWLLISSVIIMFFTDHPSKYHITISLILLGLFFLFLARKYRHAKPRKSVEYDENGNIKPKRL